MCNTLYKNKIPCKVFNASSSELFKGNVEYTVQDDSVDTSPTSIYGISKIVGHMIIEYYRNKYNLPFSNGILFTTESPYRKSIFLLKKVVLHAKNYMTSPSTLYLGNLDSWRNISHAEDTANAIKIILEQEIGDTYVICNSNFSKVEDTVIDIYKKNNIIVRKEKDTLIDTTTNSIVVQIGSGLRENSTKINGIADKLRALGWIPKYTLQSIIDDLVDMS
jgi:GDP-D-mannose dehydratase